MLVGLGERNSLTVLHPGRSGAAAAAVAMVPAAFQPLAAAFGDGDGGLDFVVWSRADESSAATLDVFRMLPDDSVTLLASAEVNDADAGSGTTRIFVGDLDPQSPGAEIVVARANDPRHGARVRIFGGLAQGRLRQLCSWSLFPRSTAPSDAIAFALVDTLAARPGAELLVAGPHGRIYIFGVTLGRRQLLGSLRPFPDRPHASAARFAVADLIAAHAGPEIAVGDDGTSGDGRVRVLAPESGEIVGEFQIFPRGGAAGGIELWAGDVARAHPGAELIAGQGSAGARLRVFSLASGVAQNVLDLPNPLARTTSLWQHLVIADLVPQLPGSEIAVAHPDPLLPVQVFSLDGLTANLRGSARAAMPGEVVSLIAPGGPARPICVNLSFRAVSEEAAGSATPKALGDTAQG